jgi:uncharacterized protein
MNVSASYAEDNHAALWWNDGNAFRSRLFDAVSLILPSGETFVGKTVSDWLQTASAESGLRAEAARFLKEEASHQRAHRLYNERLAQQSEVVKQLEQRIAAAVAEMAPWSLRTRIAYTAAFELLTNLLSKEVLRPNNVWIGQGTSSRIERSGSTSLTAPITAPGSTPQSRMWLWHCQEEIDHHDIPLNISQAAGVGHGWRVLALVCAALYLASDVVVCLGYLCASDVRAGRISAGRLLGQAAYFAVQALPSLVSMAWGCVRYVVMPSRAK